MRRQESSFVWWSIPYSPSRHHECATEPLGSDSCRFKICCHVPMRSLSYTIAQSLIRVFPLSTVTTNEPAHHPSDHSCCLFAEFNSNNRLQVRQCIVCLATAIACAVVSVPCCWFHYDAYESFPYPDARVLCLRVSDFELVLSVSL